MSNVGGWLSLHTACIFMYVMYVVLTSKLNF